MLDHEAGLEVAVDRLGCKGLHGAGLARAAADHLADLLGIEPALLGERERVGHADHRRGERDLVGELGRLALAGPAETVHLGAEGLEHGTDRVDIALGRADDEGEGAGDGTALAARHGAVERVLAHGLGGLGDIAGELGRARRQVDEVGARLSGGEQAVPRQIDLLDILGIPDHGEDHIGARGRVGGRIRPGRAAIDEGLRLRARAVVDGHGVARVHDVPGDGCPHDAGADECDFGGAIGHVRS